MANTKPNVKAEDILIKLSVLNELLDPTKKSKFFLNKENGHCGVPEDGEGWQGEYNESFRYYKHPGLPENVFLKETWQTDSYGDNDHLVQVQFVQGVAKTITVYEPIK